MSADEKCPKNIGAAWSTRPVPCGKPVKRDGLCGIHALAAERHARKRVEAVATVLAVVKAQGLWDTLTDREKSVVWRAMIGQAEAVLEAVDRYDREHGATT